MPSPATLTSRTWPPPAGTPLPPPGVIPLTEKNVRDGRAFYGPKQIVPAEEGPLGKAQRQLRRIFRAFPVTAGGGIQHQPGGLVFAELQIGGQRWMASPGRTKGDPLRPGQPVRVVTGVCLFGKGVIDARCQGERWEMMGANPRLGTQPPGVIDRVTATTGLHLQEQVTIATLSGLIRAFAALPGAGRVHVFAHVPGWEYGLFGYWLYGEGRITGGALRSYLAAVGYRHNILATAFYEALTRDPACGSGCPHWPGTPGCRKPVVVCASPLSPLWAPWAEQARITGDWRKAMAGSRDPLWRALAAQPGGNSLTTLNHYSYAYAYLDAARRAEQRCEGLWLAEFCDELPIFEHSLAAAADAGADLRRAVGTYVHPPQVPTCRGAYLYDVPVLAPS